MYAHQGHASGEFRSNLGSFTFGTTYTALFLLLLIPMGQPSYPRFADDRLHPFS